VDEYHKAALGLGEVVATVAYFNVRAFLKPA